MSTIYSLSFNNSASLVLVEKTIGCVYITCMCACLCKTDPNVELYWYIHILWTHIIFLSQMWEIFLFTKKKKRSWTFQLGQRVLWCMPIYCRHTYSKKKKCELLASCMHVHDSYSQIKLYCGSAHTWSLIMVPGGHSASPWVCVSTPSVTTLHSHPGGFVLNGVISMGIKFLNIRLLACIFQNFHIWVS